MNDYDNDNDNDMDNDDDRDSNIYRENRLLYRRS